MTDQRAWLHMAAMVPHGARVLDLGCGQGELLAYLIQNKGCSGYGVDISDHNVQAAMARGVDVLQLNLEEGLSIFEDQSFDVVLQLETMQHLRNTEVMLQETARVGRMGIVSFPNFAHWPNRLSILRGRMPVTKALPYEWYNTPNIRVTTCADFEQLAQRNQLRITQRLGLHNGQPIRVAPHWRASVGVFCFERLVHI
jgi:methionine biosynthesis protein MetW